MFNKMFSSRKSNRKKNSWTIHRKKHNILLLAGLAMSVSAWGNPSTSLASANLTGTNLSPTHFANCLAQIRASVAGTSVVNAFDRYRPAAPDPSVIESLNYQPEFKKAVWDYLAPLTDSERVHDGLFVKERYLPVLKQIQSRYGVDMHYLLGVWGIESDFGKTLGKRHLINSLATLSCFGRRQEYFRSEFIQALKIIDQDVQGQDMKGSWAGAFGHTQFMPSTFAKIAVDFDGDGRRDIVGSVPDALASTANFLRQNGYKPGQVWGYEVRKPPTVVAETNYKNKKPISHWRNLGYQLPDGRALPDTLSKAGLLAPAGDAGPLFLVGKNFDALYSYNASINYALAIAHLADLIASGQSQNTHFATPWPTDDPGISRLQAREIQGVLLASGYNIGAIDGIIGNNTTQAIRDYQKRFGLPVDGHAGQKLYRFMLKQRQSMPSQNTPTLANPLSYAPTQSSQVIASAQVPIIAASAAQQSTAQTVPAISITYPSAYEPFAQTTLASATSVAPTAAPVSMVAAAPSSIQNSVAVPTIAVPTSVPIITATPSAQSPLSQLSGSGPLHYRMVVDESGRRTLVLVQ